MPPSLSIALNAHLLSGAASFRSAGIHGYLYNTITRLADVDPSLSYDVLVGQGQITARERLNVVRSRWRTQSPMVRILWEQMAMPAILQGLNPDLLHGMGFSLPMGWRGPSVVTVYDLSFIRYPDRLSALRRVYLTTITRQAVRRATRVLAISESGKSEIQTLLKVPADRIDVARPGVGNMFLPLPADVIANFRAEQGLPDRFILHVGTLEPRKNLSMLVEAYARLPQRGEVKLVLAGGSGWQYEPMLARIEELGLKDDVILPGYVPNDMLPLWYNAAHLFVYPSIYEGFGLPILEAMACGTVTIASTASSLPEALGEDGLMVEPDDIEGWTNAMTQALTDQALRDTQRERGLAHAAALTWTHTAEQHVAAYRRAVPAS